MKREQGGSDEKAPRCPPHPLILGVCLLCGVEKKDAEGGAPGVAVGHAKVKPGGYGDGDGSGNDDAARCPPHLFVFGVCLSCGVEKKDAEGGAPRVAVGHETLKQGGDGDGDDDDARCPRHPFLFGRCLFCGVKKEDAEGAAPRVPLAPCPSRRVLPFLGVGATKEEGGGASGKIREYPAAVRASTSIPRASDLLRARKLTLILDLDHTLLNSTALKNLSPREQDNRIAHQLDATAGLFRLGLADFPMLTKLRPFARGFLEEASAMFKMTVYALGNRRYARAVVKLLDPDGAYFSDRVVSGDDSTRRDSKSLDVVPGADAATVVILDDSSHVWPEHQENLIEMDRYLYFAHSCREYRVGVSSLAELGLDEQRRDGGLAVALQVLRRVHQGFFNSIHDGRCSDVREVIRAVRSEVLRGCTVAFSRVIPLEAVASDHPMWKLAEELGAVCVADTDDTVTHVVALDPGTVKARWACKNGKFLVNPHWIMAAKFRWCRQAEQNFPVTRGPGILEGGLAY